jgi:hypothetical protein
MVSGVIDRILNLLPDLPSPQLWLGAGVVVAVLCGAGIGIGLFLRLRSPRAEETSPASWEDFTASMHDRLDQCELLLKQFAQRADKQQQELQESVTQLRASVEALEKPFSAVASRLSQIGDAGHHRG